MSVNGEPQTGSSQFVHCCDLQTLVRLTAAAFCLHIQSKMAQAPRLPCILTTCWGSGPQGPVVYKKKLPANCMDSSPGCAVDTMELSSLLTPASADRPCAPHTFCILTTPRLNYSTALPPAKTSPWLFKMAACVTCFLDV